MHCVTIFHRILCPFKYKNCKKNTSGILIRLMDIAGLNVVFNMKEMSDIVLQIEPLHYWERFFKTLYNKHSVNSH